MFSKKIDHYLKNNKVYIVPSKQGLYFLGTTVSFIFIGLFYTNNLILLIGFILLSTFIVHMFATNFNLKEVELISYQVEDNYAGEYFLLKLNLAKELESCSGLYADITFEDERVITLCLDASSIRNKRKVEVPFEIKKRGKYKIVKLNLWTRYPMGILYAWSPHKKEVEFYAYPQMKGVSLRDRFHETLEEDNNHRRKTDSLALEFDDFQKYREEMSLSRIDWRVYARTGSLFSRRFSRSDIKELKFELIDGKDIETDISQLTLWINEASQNSFFWSLKTKRYNSGSRVDQHKLVSALRELATYES